MIVEKANMMIPRPTHISPAGPRAFSNAFIVSAAPVISLPWESTLPSTPEDATTRPVTLHTTSVSKKVPVMLIYPCLEG